MGAEVELTRFRLDDGGWVTMETELPPGVVRVARTQSVIRHAEQSFQAALGDVRRAAVTALDTFRALPNRPDEVELSFGVRLDAEAGAVIARTGVHGHFEVRLRWRRADEDPPA